MYCLKPVSCNSLSHTQYGEFRTGYNKDEQDSRILVYGLRYILENYVMRPWTADDVEKADIFFK